MSNLLDLAEKLKGIQELFMALLTILQAEGNNETRYAQSELRRNIASIDLALGVMDYDDLVEAIRNARASYKSMFPPRGGLTEFFIWREGFPERFTANQKIDQLKAEINRILEP